MPDLASLLHRTFGHTSFRANQEAVCRAATDGRDVLLVMPTGAGKSLCYQLPAIARAGTALVVSPLIALMDDQAAKLTAHGLRVGRIHSGLSRDHSRDTCRDYLDGALDFLFIAPERLRVPGFPEMLARRKPSLVAIDEAHCISAWGHDFRPDYRTLGEHLPALRPAPVIALTATATPTVQRDIVAQLHLEDPTLFIHGFRRANLAIEVVEMSKPRRHEFATNLLRDASARPAIVYAPSRKSSEELAAELNRHFPAAAYHAGLVPAVREQVQRDFQSGKLEVVVATIAFGMGIDKANIRTVVHTALPASVEAFYQEIGRAGRDGLPSRTVLLHSFADRKMHEFFLERDYPPATELARVAQTLTDEYLMPEPLAQRIKMDLGTFNKAIEKLIAQGAASIDLAGNVRRTSITGKRDSWRAGYDAQIAFRRAQLDSMVAFAETQQCRMTAIIRHFGDTADAHRPCGQCDFCSPNSSAAQSFVQPTTEQARNLRTLLRALEARSTSTGKLHADLAFGIDRKQFDTLLDALARAGLITLTTETFISKEDGRTIPYKKAALTHEGRSDDAHELPGVLLPSTPLENSSKSKKSRLSKLAARVAGDPVLSFDVATGDVARHKRNTRGARAADRTPEEHLAHREAEKARVAKRAELTSAYSPQQAGLDMRLREWRKAEAATNGRPAFYVLTDAHLINVVMARPLTISELLNVKGISRAKADQFGADIVSICREGVPGPEHRTIPAQSAVLGARPLEAPSAESATYKNTDETKSFHRPHAPGDPTANLTPAQRALDAQLRAWRKAESDRIGMPQFFVLGSSALRSIVLLRPKTIAQLQTIAGIGPDQAAKFGPSIVSLCNR